jgi:hypothetical protein
VSRAEPKDPAGSPLRRLGLKEDSHLCEDLLESFAFVGQIPMQLADDTIPKSRLHKKLFGEGERN